MHCRIEIDFYDSSYRWTTKENDKGEFYSIKDDCPVNG